MRGMDTTSSAAGRWRKIIRDQQASGLAVAKYCRRSGVAAWSLYFWRRRLRAERRRGERFVEVTVARQDTGVLAGGKGREQITAPSSPSRAVSGLELHLPGRRCLVVQPGFDRPTLVELLGVLETSSVVAGQREVGENGVVRRETDENGVTTREAGT